MNNIQYGWFQIDIPSRKAKQMKACCFHSGNFSALLWRSSVRLFITVGNIITTVGDIISNVGDTIITLGVYSRMGYTISTVDGYRSILVENFMLKLS